MARGIVSTRQASTPAASSLTSSCMLACLAAHGVVELLLRGVHPNACSSSGVALVLRWLLQLRHWDGGCLTCAAQLPLRTGAWLVGNWRHVNARSMQVISTSSWGRAAAACDRRSTTTGARLLILPTSAAAAGTSTALSFLRRCCTDKSTVSSVHENDVFRKNRFCK